MPNVSNTANASSWGPIFDTTIAKGQIVLNAAAKAGHEVTRVYGYNSTPDHNNKQCIDFMHYDDTAMRDWLVSYLIDNAKNLGVEGIISNRRVMGFPSQGTMYRGPEGQWRPYSGPSPHTDHCHVQFNRTPVSGHVEPVSTGSVKVTDGGKVKAVTCALHGVIRAAKADPGRKQGGTTAGAVDDVKVLEKALQAEGLLPAKYASDGSFGSTTVAAYAKWQKKLGYTGKDADGIPGRASLEALGKRHGFTVVDHD